MPLKNDIQATAKHLIDEYDDNASKEAVMRADAFLEMGEPGQQQFWLRVRDAINSMKNGAASSA